MKYGVLILAAGASTRMGTSKQLLKIGGQSLIRKTITTALETGIDPVVVVLGANAEAHNEEIKDLKITVVNNPNWDLGIGSSIKIGVEYLSKIKIDAFFILVCDQPLLTSEHLQKLTECYEKSKVSVVSSGYKATQGVPALFAKSMTSSLLLLKDKEGAKRIMLDKGNLIVDFKGGEIDLDTPNDFNLHIKIIRGY